MLLQAVLQRQHQSQMNPIQTQLITLRGLRLGTLGILHLLLYQQRLGNCHLCQRHHRRHGLTMGSHYFQLDQILRGNCHFYRQHHLRLRLDIHLALLGQQLLDNCHLCLQQIPIQIWATCKCW